MRYKKYFSICGKNFFFTTLISFFLLSNVSFVYSQQSPENSKKITVYIYKGMTFREITNLLKQSGVLKYPRYFKFLSWITKQSKNIKYGEYTFSPQTDTYTVLQILVKGESQLRRITFPEGYNLFEMADLLEKEGFVTKKEFISVARNPEWVSELLKEPHSSLEGYLFPDTYFFAKGVSAQFISETMVKRFFEIYSRLPKEDSKTTLTQHEVVTLASIVEKETGAPEERALIASVFYNRIKKKMRLESDPTILYGMLLEADGVPVTNIRKQDIKKKTAYNTYQISGFPPGPITNPGKEALSAIFHPEESSFLYFVSRNDGTHVFSKNFKTHQKMVNKYQRYRKRKKN